MSVFYENLCSYDPRSTRRPMTYQINWTTSGWYFDILDPNGHDIYSAGGYLTALEAKTGALLALMQLNRKAA